VGQIWHRLAELMRQTEARGRRLIPRRRGQINPRSLLAGASVFAALVLAVFLLPRPNAAPVSLAQEVPTATPAIPDLAVAKVDDPDPVASGGSLTYTIEVRNVGTGDAAGVRLIDTPPASFTYTSFSTTRGTCVLVGSLVGGTLDCDLGFFGTGPAAFATVTIGGYVSTPSTTIVTNTATVDPNNTIAESIETNNAATIDTTVQGPTATPTITQTPTVTDTPTITPTPTDTGTPTSTGTATNTPTITTTPTITNTPTITTTPTPTDTSTPTVTPTPLPSLVVVLPGQSLAPGVGVTGTPDAQTAGTPFAVDFYTVSDTFTIVPLNLSTVELTTEDPHDAEPAPQPLAAGHASFTIDPRTATGTGWRAVPSGGPGSNVPSSPYLVGPAAVSQTVVVLPGETLEAGLGLQNTADHQVLDTPFAIEVVAVDPFFNTVPTAVGTVSLNVTCATYCQGLDSGDITPASQALGSGRASFTHTPATLGTWQGQPSGGPGTNAPSQPFVVSARIDTVAGNGQAGFAGDGGAAASARFTLPLDVARDGAGNLYVADSGNNRVRRISPSGIVTTFAGGGSGACGGAELNSVGDGCPATQAVLRAPAAMAVDAAGNVFIADQLNQRIRMVNTTGIIITVAGNGVAGFSGDDGPAPLASLRNPFGLAFDGAGNLYIADASNHRIRRVNAFGLITTAAGSGVAGYDGDGIQAVNARLNFPTDIAFDPAGTMYIADSANSVVRGVSPAGMMSTFAGRGQLGRGGEPGFSGDGGPATAAHLTNPFGLAVDGQGQVFVADTGNQRVRMVNAAGVITTVAGSGASGFGGDGGPATAARLDLPIGMTVAQNGRDVLFADMNNHRIRRLVGVANLPPPPPPPTPTPTGTATLTPTITSTPTITPTPTPVCPDSDGDTLNDCAELSWGTDPNIADTDGDGCADGEELGGNPSLGGRRSPTNFWDFFDTIEPAAVPSRDKAVSLSDVFRVATRFGATGDETIDPLSTPPPAPAYHPSYDRSSPPSAVEEPDPSKREPWDLRAADGGITVTDVFMIAIQFGHSCVAAP